VRIVPGISTIQIAASRARTPLESSIVVTLHRRGDLEAELDRLGRLAGELHLLVLPRPYDYMPERIARSLLDRGIEGDLDATVYERLTFDDERATHTTVEGLASGETAEESAFCDLSVLVVRRS
jgi:cobalt-precorrin-7 (C5)-methyltransferase